MAEDIYQTTTNTKHNLDGEEDVTEVFIMPREQVRMREKVIRIKKHETVTANGLHFDWHYSSGFFDNASLQFDAIPNDPTEIAIICPFNAFKEHYYNTDFVDSVNSNVTFDSINNRYICDDTEILISNYIQFLPLKAFKEVKFLVNNNNSDLLERYIDIGDNIWRQVTGDSLNISDSISFGESFDSELDFELTGLLFENKLRYRIVNTTGEVKYINKVDISFIYYE